MFMTLVSKTGCINHVLVAVYIVITKSNKLYSLWLRIFILNYKQTSNQQKGSVISTSRESLIYINELNIFNKLKILGSVHICFVTITYITVTFPHTNSQYKGSVLHLPQSPFSFACYFWSQLFTSARTNPTCEVALTVFVNLQAYGVRDWSEHLPSSRLALDSLLLKETTKA